jgi:hypothetical protein
MGVKVATRGAWNILSTPAHNETSGKHFTFNLRSILPSELNCHMVGLQSPHEHFPPSGTAALG